MEGAAKQPGQGRGVHRARVVVAALHHRQGGFADGEDVAGQQQGSGVVAQHGCRIVENPQQVGADRQHLAGITLAPEGVSRGDGLRPAQGNQHAIAALQAAEGAVIHPVDVEPEGVQQGPDRGFGRGAEAQVDAGASGFAALDDVGEPVAIGPGRLIGVVGIDLDLDGHVSEPALAQQGGQHLELGHHHLHAGVGVADLDLALHHQAVGFAAHLPGATAQLQGRSRPQPMAQLQHQQAQANEQGAGQGQADQGMERQHIHGSMTAGA